MITECPEDYSIVTIVLSFIPLYNNTLGTAGGPVGRGHKKQKNGRKKKFFFLKKLNLPKKHIFFAYIF